MNDLFKTVFATGGWLGILAAIALVVAYVKEKQVIKLRDQLDALHAQRVREAKETAVILHRMLSNYGPRKPVVSIHEDDDEVSSVISVKEQLQEQAKDELAPDIRELLKNYMKNGL